VRDVREEYDVENAVNAACKRWSRADEAWEAVKWALAHDPYSAGPAITESGLIRVFVFEGAQSIGMPTIRAVYAVEPTAVSIKAVEFEDSTHLYAGRA
jgi:hypothetical protein